MGATRANDFPRQADDYGQEHGHLPSPRTGPDDSERLTGIYRSDGRRLEACCAIGFRHIRKEAAKHLQLSTENTDGMKDAVTRAELGFTWHLSENGFDSGDSHTQFEQQNSSVGRDHCAVVVLHPRPLHQERGLDLFLRLKIWASTFPELIAKRECYLLNTVAKTHVGYPSHPGLASRKVLVLISACCINGTKAISTPISGLFCPRQR